MNFRDLNELGKDNSNNNSLGQFVSNFIKELSDTLQKNQNKKNNDEKISQFKQEIEKISNDYEKINNLQELEEGKIYVITGISDEKLEVLDPKDGYNFDIYISINETSLKKLSEEGIHSKIYEMSKEEFYKLEQGNKLIMKNGKCVPYYGKIEIENDEAFEILDNLYFNLKHEEGRNYVVTDIKDGKIYMRDTEVNGYYELYEELYPDLHIGDIVTRKDGKYLKK